MEYLGNKLYYLHPVHIVTPHHGTVTEKRDLIQEEIGAG